MQTLTTPSLPLTETGLVSGLVAGTAVLTLDGELPVEHLEPGDRVITRDSGLAVLKRIEVAEVETGVVRIKAGSLGHTRPDRDMCVAPGTAILIRDWRAQALYAQASAMVPAARLIDGEFVAAEASATRRIYRLVFDRNHVVYADGLEIGA